jgi:hypothetical protein
MTEQPTTPQQPDDENGSTARDVSRAGGGRTEGETSVDDALGQGDEGPRG